MSTNFGINQLLAGSSFSVTKSFGSAIMCRMKNNRLALEALPEVSTHQRLFFSVLYKMALPAMPLNR